MPDVGDEGREAVFDAFYRTHYGAVSGYVRRRASAHDVSDIVAQVFVVAWRRFQQVPDPPEDRLWLIGVARRCAADNRRSGLRRRRLQERLVRHAKSSLARPDEASLRSRVYEALEALRPVDREALRLVLWDGLSHAEAAAVLGCSVNAFELRYRRARARVGGLLDRGGSTEQSVPEPTPDVAREARRTPS